MDAKYFREKAALCLRLAECRQIIPERRRPTKKMMRGTLQFWTERVRENERNRSARLIRILGKRADLSDRTFGSCPLRYDAAAAAIPAAQSFDKLDHWGARFDPAMCCAKRSKTVISYLFTKSGGLAMFAAIRHVLIACGNSASIPDIVGKRERRRSQ
jgi:hypothetical protein